MTTRELARLATSVENGASEGLERLAALPPGEGLIVGVTGPPGAGKSSLVDALAVELRARGKTIAIVAVDPTSRTSHGAILGDRVRMQRHHADPGVFIRSMATRGASGGLARTSAALSRLFRSAGYDFIIIETVGVGQDEIEVAAVADVTVVVLVPGMGDDVQAIKAGIMEIADIFVINKADRPGAEQTQRDIQAMLSLGHGAAVPSILRTAALEGTGIPELADELLVRQRKIQTGPVPGWQIDHLGIAVRSIEGALQFYESHLGLTVLSRETVEHEKVKVAMIPAGDSRIELLEPLNEDSTIARFIARRGPGIHHIAMRVPDLHTTLKRLAIAGVRVLNPPQRGAGGHLYVFIHPVDGGNVLWEIIQE